AARGHRAPRCEDARRRLGIIAILWKLTHWPCVLVAGFLDEAVAAKKSSTAKANKTKAPGVKRRRGVALRPTELSAHQLADASGAEGLACLVTRVEQDRGEVL